MMKKKYLTIVACFIILLPIHKQSIAQYAKNVQISNGVVFENLSLEAAITKAKAENKYVFVCLFATWCGWCTHMKNKTYPNKKLGDYFKSKFIVVRINGEKGGGRAIVKKYGITAYPAQFVINTEGQLITGSIGYKKADELLTELTKVFK